MAKALAYFFYSVFFVLFYFANPIWAGTFIDNNNGTVTDKNTGKLDYSPRFLYVIHPPEYLYTDMMIEDRLYYYYYYNN